MGVGQSNFGSEEARSETDGNPSVLGGLGVASEQGGLLDPLGSFGSDHPDIGSQDPDGGALCDPGTDCGFGLACGSGAKAQGSEAGEVVEVQAVGGPWWAPGLGVVAPGAAGVLDPEEVDGPLITVPGWHSDPGLLVGELLEGDTHLGLPRRVLVPAVIDGAIGDDLDQHAAIVALDAFWRRAAMGFEVGVEDHACG